MSIPLRWKADAALVGVTFIWGSTFVVVKNALADSSTILFLVLRFTVASAMLVMLARRTRVDRRLCKASLLVGSALFSGYLFQTLGLRLTSPSKSAFITGFSVVLVPIIAGIAFRRFPGWAPLTGVGAAIAGLYLLTLPASNQASTPATLRGDLLTLTCAAAFALHIIFVGRYSGAVPATGLAAGQVVVTALLALASLPWAEPIFLRPSPRLILTVLLTGLLATALAFSVQTWAQQFTTPTHTALIFSLEPVFAWLTSWIAGSEKLGTRAGAGAALILAGIILAEVAASRRGLAAAPDQTP